MIDPKYLDELAQKVAGNLPAGLTSFKEELDRTLRAGVEALLARMDLVTREEFDVQAAVLARTRDKLHQLEQQVAELERRVGATHPDADH
jgi:BMFP domain-containing protein YqiC